jgi:hypothetical protein
LNFIGANGSNARGCGILGRLQSDGNRDPDPGPGGSVVEPGCTPS